MASVDIAIPSYQYGRYIGDCLRSILSQGIDDLRILVIDNASTDDSVAVARHFAAADPRIEVRARPVNLGPHASFNEGVDWAKADYFMLLCADDFLTPGSLARSIAVMEKHPEASFSFGSFIQYQDGGALPEANGPADASWKVWPGRDFINRCCTGMVLTVSPLMRTAALKKAGHFRPELFHYDDLEMLLRLASFGPVAETAAPQAVQRLHQANLSQGTWKDPILRFREEEQLYESFFAHEGRAVAGADAMRRRARRNVGKRVYWSAMAHLSRGDARNGVTLLRYAFRLCPSAAVLPPVDYLFQIDKPFARIGSAITSAMGIRRQDRPLQGR